MKGPEAFKQGGGTDEMRRGIIVGLVSRLFGGSETGGEGNGADDEVEEEEKRRRCEPASQESRD